METKIGKGVNAIVKASIFKNDEISQISLDLVNQWKDLVNKKETQKKEKS